MLEKWKQRAMKMMTVMILTEKITGKNRIYQQEILHL